MTVSAVNDRSGPYVGNGSTTVFPFTFAARLSGEVLPYVNDAAQLSGFTVALNANYQGGTVTFAAAPTAGAVILIQSNPAFTQGIAFENAGAFLPETVDEALDRSAIRDISLRGRVDTAEADVDGLSIMLDSEIDARQQGDAGLAAALAAAVIEASAGPIPELKVKTPYMFGALGNGVDDTVALQAFFDDAISVSNARTYVYDWSGEWAVSDTLYALYWDGFEPDVERRFIMGTLRVSPLASLPGGLPLDYVLEIAGFRMRWDGVCGIHETGAHYYANTTWATRRFKRGVRIRGAHSSTFGDFRVDGAQRDAVYLEGRDAGFTAGGVTVASSNSIGTHINSIVARYCGCAEHAGTDQAPTPLIAAAITQGSTVNDFGVGDQFTSSVPAPNSTSQRTKITTGGGTTTAGLEVWDQIWCRVELTPAIYGTIAVADNGDDTFTITWTAGDPTDLNGSGDGLQVGDIYPFFQAGPNVGKRVRIISFGGTSNRSIVVGMDEAGEFLFPLTAHAATADATYKQYGPKTLHWITQVIDANNVVVVPSIQTCANSTFHIVFGAAWNCAGEDTANVSVGFVSGFLCGVGYQALCNYAPTVNTVLAEACIVGLRINNPGSGMLGYKVAHGHAEGNDFDLVVGWPSLGEIRMSSSFNLASTVCFGARGGTLNGTELDVSYGIGKLMIYRGGVLIECPNGSGTGSGNSWAQFGISNAVHYRQIHAHANSLALDVWFDRAEAMNFFNHHWAELTWTGDAGAAPTGTLTLNMNPTLANLGWAFAGAGSGSAYSIVAPATNICVKLQFLPEFKKVALTRLA